MTTWEERKAAGDELERRVREELERRGWTVAEWGQAILPAAIRAAVSRTPWRHFSDLVATRDGDLVAIDCKDRMASTQTGRYAIKRDCVSFGLQFHAAFGVPVFYVFGNLGVLTPQEVSSYGTIGPRGLWGRGGSYYLVSGRLGHRFDDVFGAGTDLGMVA
jgi:Holliday junction resolvase